MALIRKPAIPTTGALPRDLGRFLSPIKDNIDIITGVRSGGIVQLAATATTTDSINKINEIIARLNQAGQ